MSIIRIEATQGAAQDGVDFLSTIVDAVANDGSVYIQIAGEYGHLRVEDIEVIEE